MEETVARGRWRDTRSILSIQEFWKRRDGLLVAGEPPIRGRNRQVVAIEKVIRQLEQGELVCERIFVDRVSHERELVHPAHTTARRRCVLGLFRNQ
jgi:hypothetical protein